MSIILSASEFKSQLGQFIELWEDLEPAAEHGILRKDLLQALEQQDDQELMDKIRHAIELWSDGEIPFDHRAFYEDLLIEISMKIYGYSAEYFEGHEELVHC